MQKKFEFKVYATAELAEDERARIHQLFDITYRDANHGYLDKSLEVMGYISVASLNGTIAGFGVGNTIETSIPGISGLQIVALAGIGCIAPAHRRQGLFGNLAQLALRASGVSREGKLILAAGRMAHPAGFRSMSRNPTVVPKFDVPITPWQRDVGLRIAELYDVRIDPETFVVQGSGVPIGYPNIEIDVPESEWRIFSPVDRDKGDSLLALSWTPNAPEGW